MINFYKLYNKTGLDKEEYSLLIEKLLDEKYTNEISLIEHIIKKNPKNAYWYAEDIIKGRWPEAEPVIMTRMLWAYRYAEAIIKGRWPEAEPYIMESVEYAYMYAQFVIKGRWKEAEETIMTEKYWWNKYYDRFIANY